MTPVLMREFGLGDQPDLRSKLYARIDAAVRKHGEPAAKVVTTAIAKSRAAQRPGSYFSRIVLLMLREAGFDGEVL